MGQTYCGSTEQKVKRDSWSFPTSVSVLKATVDSLRETFSIVGCFVQDGDATLSVCAINLAMLTK